MPQGTKWKCILHKVHYNEEAVTSVVYLTNPSIKFVVGIKVLKVPSTKWTSIPHKDVIGYVEKPLPLLAMFCIRLISSFSCHSHIEKE